MNIGWIGLGNMGMPMAIVLKRFGHNVVGYDANEQSVRAAAQHGIRESASIAEAVDSKDVVFTMLPSGNIAEKVYCATDGIFNNAHSGTLLIDSSTIDVASARYLHNVAAERGFQFCDAPVSGGTAGARNGTLTFMIGGEHQSVELAKQVIEPMARTMIATGGPTTGQAVKICNNLMALVNLTGLAEASALAERLGVDHKVLHEVATTSSGQSWMMDNWYPYPGVVEQSPANKDFTPSFTANLAVKDLTLAVDAAAEESMSLDVGRAALALYQALSEFGGDDYDCTAVRTIADGSGPLDSTRSASN